MAHDDSTWLARTRAVRLMRWTTSIGLVLACVLFVALPATASATPSNYDMRGEWAFELIGKPPTPNGHVLAVITKFEPTSGAYSGSAVLDGEISGSIAGTASGDNASIEMTATIPGEGAYAFNAAAATIEPAANTLSGSGSVFKNGKEVETGTVTGIRIKTYQEVQEREEREAKEKLEREARENIRGEWSLVVKVGSQTSSGTALIKTAAGTDNKFASSSALFEGVVPGSFSGTLEGATATVTVNSEAYGPAPALEFIGEKIGVNPSGESLSISGTGKLYSNKTLVSENATLLAKRVKTYAEVTASEAKEKAELEAKEQRAKAEAEAKAKAEAEAKAKAEAEAKAEAQARAEAEAKAKTEQEVKAKAEAQARAEAEAKAKTEQETQKADLAKTALVSVRLLGTSFTLSTAGMLTLPVSNPNAYAISGRITLAVSQSAKLGKASTAHGPATRKSLSLGSVSFGIAPDGKQLLKLDLNQAGHAELTRHKTLRVLATILTKATGQTSTTKTLTFTLRVVKASSKG
jgi:hypothetical protein